jgi:hypothetical protein
MDPCHTDLEHPHGLTVDDPLDRSYPPIVTAPLTTDAVSSGASGVVRAARRLSV